MGMELCSNIEKVLPYLLCRFAVRYKEHCLVRCMILSWDIKSFAVRLYCRCCEGVGGRCVEMLCRGWPFALWRVIFRMMKGYLLHGEVSPFSCARLTLSWERCRGCRALLPGGCVARLSFGCVWLIFWLYVACLSAVHGVSFDCVGYVFRIVCGHPALCERWQ